MGIFDKLFNKGKNANSQDEILTIPDKWTVLQGQNNSKPMLIRKNTGCNDIAGHSLYSLNCGIAFKFLYPREDGFPDTQNEPDLWTLEDEIFELYQTEKIAIVSVIITTSGFREYVLYAKDQEAFMLRLNFLRQKYTQYELTNYCKPDPDWNNFKTIG